MAKNQTEQLEQEETNTDEGTLSEDGSTRTLKVEMVVKEDINGDKREFKGTREIPATVQGFVDTFGEEIVYGITSQGFLGRLKSYIRPSVIGEEITDAEGNVTGTKIYDDGELQQILDDYTPNASRGRQKKSDLEKVGGVVDTMDDMDALRALQEKINAKLAAQAAA